MKLPTLLPFSLALTLRGVAGIGLDESKIDEFHAVIAKAMEAEGVRGAAYAFRGPGMDHPVLGAYGHVGQADDSPLVDVNTAFMLASLSKTFTGAAVGVLVDQGIIFLDDDICEAIGDINSACRHPEFPDTPVTWRMLVTHRSSIIGNLPYLEDGSDPSYGPTGVNYDNPIKGNRACPIDDVEQFYEDVFIEKATETSVGQDDGLNVNWFDFLEEEYGGIWESSTEPGAVSEYSNMGVSYIAALLPKVTNGTNFREFCKEFIFEPAGMNTTAWFREELPSGTLVAIPMYNQSKDWEEVGHFCWANYADGQLYSSITDLALWAEAQVRYGIDIFWSNETAVNDVYGCQEKDVDGAPVDKSECEYAMTWILGNPPGSSKWSQLDWTNNIFHEGSETGVATNMIVLPEEHSYVIVLFNTEGANVEYFADGIAEVGMGILLGEGNPAYFDENEAVLVLDDDDAVTSRKNMPASTATAENEVPSAAQRIFSYVQVDWAIYAMAVMLILV